MSTGAFVPAKYEDGLNNDIHPCRVQPETLQLNIGGVANAQPAGNVNNPVRAFSSSRRRRGAVCMRKVGVVIESSGPNGYKVGSILYIPVFVASRLNQYLDPPDQLGTYNGADVRVVGSSAERINP